MRQISTVVKKVRRNTTHALLSDTEKYDIIELETADLNAHIRALSIPIIQYERA